MAKQKSSVFKEESLGPPPWSVQAKEEEDETKGFNPLERSDAGADLLLMERAAIDGRSLHREKIARKFEKIAKKSVLEEQIWVLGWKSDQKIEPVFLLVMGMEELGSESWLLKEPVGPPPWPGMEGKFNGPKESSFREALVWDFNSFLRPLGSSFLLPHVTEGHADQRSSSPPPPPPLEPPPSYTNFPVFVVAKVTRSDRGRLSGWEDSVDNDLGNTQPLNRLLPVHCTGQTHLGFEYEYGESNLRSSIEDNACFDGVSMYGIQKWSSTSHGQENTLQREEICLWGVEPLGPPPWPWLVEIDVDEGNCFRKVTVRAEEAESKFLEDYSQYFVIHIVSKANSEVSYWPAELELEGKERSFSLQLHGRKYAATNDPGDDDIKDRNFQFLQVTSGSSKLALRSRLILWRDGMLE